MVIKSNLDRTPVQNKKRPKRVNSTEEEEKRPKALNSITEEDGLTEISYSSRRPSEDGGIHNSSTASTRPSRSAKSKAATHLKEPKLNTKMRQNGEIVVKQERISIIPEDSENNPNSTNVVNVTSVKTEKSNLRKKSNDGIDDNDKNNSVELVQEQIEHIEIDDDAEMMVRMLLNSGKHNESKIISDFNFDKNLVRHRIRVKKYAYIIQVYQRFLETNLRYWRTLSKEIVVSKIIVLSL